VVGSVMSSVLQTLFDYAEQLGGVGQRAA